MTETRIFMIPSGIVVSPVNAADRTRGGLQPERLPETGRVKQVLHRSQREVGTCVVFGVAEENRRAERRHEVCGEYVRATAETVIGRGKRVAWQVGVVRGSRSCRLPGEQQPVVFTAELREGQVHGGQQQKHDGDDSNRLAPGSSFFLPSCLHHVCTAASTPQSERPTARSTRRIPSRLSGCSRVDDGLRAARHDLRPVDSARGSGWLPGGGRA